MYQAIRPVPGLGKLKFLAEIHTREEYIKKCDGPYLVGEILDKEGFTKKAGSSLEFRLWKTLGSEALHLQQQTIINEILQLDIEIGFKPVPAVVCFEQGYVQPGRVQRSSENGFDFWHQDNGGLERANWPIFPRHYIAVSNDGTLFLPERLTKGLETHLEVRNKFAPADERVIRGKDYGIYLMPRGCWHQSPVLKNGGSRTFLRVGLYKDDPI